MGYLYIPEPPLEPPEDRVVCYCNHCGGEIYEGGEFYRIENQVICAACLGEFAEEYFADYQCGDEDSYLVDGQYIDSADLERFARGYFAGEREEAEITTRARSWRLY